LLSVLCAISDLLRQTLVEAITTRKVILSHIWCIFTVI